MQNDDFIHKILTDVIDEMCNDMFIKFDKSIENSNEYVRFIISCNEYIRNGGELFYRFTNRNFKKIDEIAKEHEFWLQDCILLQPKSSIMIYRYIEPNESSYYDDYIIMCKPWIKPSLLTKIRSKLRFK